MIIYRGYDAEIDSLVSADKVMDAYVQDGRVSTYEPGNGEGFVVVTTPVNGLRLDVLVSAIGWLPLDMVPFDDGDGLEPEPDADGHQWDYVINTRRRLRLSPGDFQKISAAIRAHLSRPNRGLAGH
jgi:hypothetical protein